MKKRFIKYILGLMLGIFGFSVGFVFAHANYGVYEYPNRKDTCQDPKWLLQPNSHLHQTLNFNTDGDDYFINDSSVEGGEIRGLSVTTKNTRFNVVRWEDGRCKILTYGQTYGGGQNRILKYYMNPYSSFNSNMHSSQSGGTYTYEITFDLNPDLHPWNIRDLNTQLAPGDSDAVKVKVSNDGNQNIIKDIEVYFYYSSDSNINTSDTKIGSYTIRGGLPYYNETGTSNEPRATITIPPTAVEGTRYIGVIVDPNNKILEKTETNNTSVQSFTVTIKKPDITYSNMTTDKTSACPNDILTVNADLKNIGDANASNAPWAVYLSTNNTITNDDRQIWNSSTSLNAGASKHINPGIALPSNLTYGQTYYAGIFMDYNGIISEKNETNNTNIGNKILAIKTQAQCAPKADLVVTGIDAPMSASRGQTISVTPTIQNQGGTNAGSFNLNAYFSTDSTITADDSFLKTYTISSLNAGSNNSTAISVKIPTSAPDNQLGYIGVIADVNNSVSESNESNNSKYKDISITNNPDGDPDDDDVLNKEEIQIGTNPNVFDSPAAVEESRKEYDLHKADPVNTRTGAFTLDQTDFYLGGRGQDINIARSYDNNINKNGRFGYNWQSSYNMFYYEKENGDTEITMDNGEIKVFTFNGSSYNPPVSSRDLLVKSADGTFTMTDKNNTKYKFTEKFTDQFGFLKEIEDLNGNKISFDYETNNEVRRVSKITDSSGRAFTFIYNGNNKVTRITDFLGHSKDFFYDSNDNLIRTEELRTYPGETDEKIIWQFEYDSDHNIISYTNPEGIKLRNEYFTNTKKVYRQYEEVDGISHLFTTYLYEDINGETQTTLTYQLSDSETYSEVYRYNSDGLIVWEKDGENNQTSYTWDGNGLLQTVTKPGGVVTSYTYDSKRRMITQILPNILNFNGDTYSTVIVFGYDDRFDKVNSVSTTSVKNGIDIKTQTTTYTYDEKGNLISSTAPDNKSESFLYNQFGNLLSSTDKNGNTTTYSYDPNNNYITRKQLQITKPSNQTLSTDYTVNEYGHVLTENDGQNPSTKFKYDSKFNIREIEDALGNVTYIKYNLRDKKTYVKDPEGHEFNLTYKKNMFGSLESTTQINPTGENIVISSTYDYQGRKLSDTDPNGNILSYTYFKNGKIKSKKDALNKSETYTYDSRGNVIQTTDRNGNTSNFEYNLRDQLTKSIQPKLENQTDRGFSEMAYDGFNNLISTKDPNGNISNFEYNNRNFLTASVNPLGDRVERFYDNNGNVLGEIDPMRNLNEDGYTVSYVYDEAGRVIQTKNADNKVSIIKYDKVSNVLESIINADSNGGNSDHKVSYVYDVLNRPTQVTDMNGISETYTYDKLGNVKNYVNKAGQIITYEYDVLGRTSVISSVSNPDRSVGGATKGSDPLVIPIEGSSVIPDSQVVIPAQAGIYSSFQYDKNGNILKQITTGDGKSVSVENTYDANNNLISTKDNAGNISNYSYDNLGQVLALTDAKNNVTSYGYNALGLLESEKRRQQNQTDILLSTFLYDKSGSLLSKNLDGIIETYEYDQLGRLKKSIKGDNTFEEYIYDVNGNTSVISTGASEASGVEKSISFQYDSLNRLIKKLYPDNSQVTYSYDNWSNLKTLNDLAGTQTFDYDRMGMPVYENRSFNDLPGKNYEVRRSYTPFNALDTLTYPDNTTVNFSYDNMSRVSEVKNGSQVLASYNYDGLSNLTNENLGNGIKVNRTYDELNRIASMEAVNSNNETQLFEGYAYDAVSNRTQLKDKTGSVLADYSYDFFDQLTNVDYKDTTQPSDLGYAYDNRFNRTSLNSALQSHTYEYDAQTDRLTSLVISSGSSPVIPTEVEGSQSVIPAKAGISFTYSPTGSLTKESYMRLNKTYKERNFVYDYEERLKQIQIIDMEKGIPELNSVSTVNFAYDDFGNRVKKSIDGGETKYYLNQGLNLLAEIDSEGNISKKYIYGINLIGTIDSEGNFTYTVQDGLGSTRMSSDESGVKKSEKTYDPYGSTEYFESESTQNNLYAQKESIGFTNQEEDPETGLIYMNARYYNPLIGRFITEDPYSGSIADAKSLNRYTYAANNPLKYTDPTGMWYFTTDANGKTRYAESIYRDDECQLTKENIEYLVKTLFFGYDIEGLKDLTVEELVEKRMTPFPKDTDENYKPFSEWDFTEWQNPRLPYNEDMLTEQELLEVEFLKIYSNPEYNPSSLYSFKEGIKLDISTTVPLTF